MSIASSYIGSTGTDTVKEGVSGEEFMILWTIQLEEVYKIVLNIGTYHFDFNRSNMNEWKTV